MKRKVDFNLSYKDNLKLYHLMLSKCKNSNLRLIVSIFRVSLRFVKNILNEEGYIL